MEDAITTSMQDEESDGWAVAGVLTDLSGALLTTRPGEAGLAGTMEMHHAPSGAANDDRYEG